MNKQTFLWLAIAVVVFGGIIFFAVSYNSKVQAPTTNNTPNVPVVWTTEKGNKDIIKISSLSSGAKIASPLTVMGEARGNWFFEASFPVTILDSDGKLLGKGIAQAQGEWMTSDFVPFVATISFATPTTKTGTLILHKDNPSDMRQFDDSLSLPVVF